MLNQNQKAFLDFMEQCPLTPNQYYDYLKFGIYIINIMLNRDTSYGHLELIHNIYSKTNDISYNTFLKNIKEGEKANLWGLYKVNGFYVLYLKRKAYKVHLGKDKSHVTPDRITTDMLARSILKLTINCDRIEKYNSSYTNSLYYLYIGNKKRLILLTIADRLFTNDVKKGQPFRTELISHGVNKNIMIISPYVISKTTINNFSKDEFIIKTKLVDIKKYFNGLPL